MKPYQDLIEIYSQPGCDPDVVLSFLSWAPEYEVGALERCSILRATLETVVNRLRILEDTRG